MAKFMYVLSALSTTALAVSAAAEAIVLDGRDFWSTKVTVDGQEKTLVPGTRIKIGFGDEGGGVSASAGCNSIGSESYTVDDGVLVIGDMFQTEMGCLTDGLEEQDEFLAGFLASRPKIVLRDDGMVLSTDAITIDFLDRKIADPDRPFVGTDWIVNGFFSKLAASARIVEKHGWIKFGDDGKISYYDGCSEGQRTYSVSDAGDMLSFGEAVGVKGTCEGMPENVVAYATDFNKIFETGSVSYEIVGPHLKVTNSNEDGVSFLASDGKPRDDGSSAGLGASSSAGLRKAVLGSIMLFLFL